MKIKKTSTPTVKYEGHCLRYRHTLVGKNYLLLFHIMEDTAPDNVVRTGSVQSRRAVRQSRGVCQVWRVISNATPVSVQQEVRKVASDCDVFSPGRRTCTLLLADAAFVISTV